MFFFCFLLLNPFACFKGIFAFPFPGESWQRRKINFCGFIFLETFLSFGIRQEMNLINNNHRKYFNFALKNRGLIRWEFSLLCLTIGVVAAMTFQLFSNFRLMPFTTQHTNDPNTSQRHLKSFKASYVFVTLNSKFRHITKAVVAF